MRFLSGKEKKELKEKIPLGYNIDKKDNIKEEDNLLFKDDEKLFIIKNNMYYPHLKTFPQENYKTIYVDDGAVKFLAKGADLMRPGIEEIEFGFEKDDIIQIKNKKLPKVLALGIAMYSDKKINEMTQGKVVQIYHYIGDEFY